MRLCQRISNSFEMYFLMLSSLDSKVRFSQSSGHTNSGLFCVVCFLFLSMYVCCVDSSLLPSVCMLTQEQDFGWFPPLLFMSLQCDDFLTEMEAGKLAASASC